MPKYLHYFKGDDFLYLGKFINDKFCLVIPVTVRHKSERLSLNILIFDY